MKRRKLLGRIPLYITVTESGCERYALEWPIHLYEAFHGRRLKPGQKPIDATMRSLPGRLRCVKKAGEGK